MLMGGCGDKIKKKIENDFQVQSLSNWAGGGDIN